MLVKLSALQNKQQTIMAINSKPVPKENPENPAAPKKYYAQTVSAGDVSLRQLAKMNVEKQ